MDQCPPHQPVNCLFFALSTASGISTTNSNNVWFSTDMLTSFFGHYFYRALVACMPTLRYLVEIYPFGQKLPLIYDFCIESLDNGFRTRFHPGCDVANVQRL